MFGFLSGEDLKRYQYSFISAYLLLHPKIHIRGDLYSRLAESLLESGSKYEVDRTNLHYCIFLVPQSYKRIWYNFFPPKGKGKKK